MKNMITHMNSGKMFLTLFYLLGWINVYAHIYLIG